MKKNWIPKILRVISSFALMLTILNVNSLCVFSGHQPRVPMCADRLKKQ